MTLGLRLRAMDGEDLCVLAALLQDARIPINEMLFEPDRRRFLAAFRRCRRELEPSADAHTPCLSVLRLEQVDAVRWRGLAPDRPTEEHVLLTLLEEAPGRLLLVFQGGEALRFEVSRIDARLEDVVGEAGGDHESVT